MIDVDPIDELLQQVLVLPEGEWRAGIAQLCARHPAHAAELGRRFEFLCALGFHRAGSAPEEGFRVPERLGEFQLTERLGQGGMGVVYAARQERLGRTVALKLMRPEQLYFPGTRERFQREIAAVAKLSHHGIVSVLSVGEEQGIPYLAMELLRGASLDDVVRALAGRHVEELGGADLARVVAARAGAPVEQPEQEPFNGPWTTVCTALVRRLAQAVAHAHHHGIVHRDIKPSNVMVTPEGRVVLLDFGVAQPDGVDRMTRAGTQVGSLPYMAPEQLRGEVGDARTDVYGLGVLLREILTLQQPFLTTSSETTRHRILHGEGRPLLVDNRAVSWELATVCAQATEPDPRRRYASAADLARDLDHVLAKRPITARPAGVVRRVVRWAQRRPTLATGLFLGALAAIGTPTAIAVGIAGQRDRARAAEAAQEQKACEANLAAANAALQVRDVAEARRRLEACPRALRGFEWQHLSLAVDGSLATLAGHQAPVSAVAMTADASLLASGSNDGRVRLWDLRRGVTLHEFTHHAAGIWQMAFSADGRRLDLHDVAGHTSVVDVAARVVRAERRRTSSQDTVALGTDGSTVLASLGGWRIVELDPDLLTPRREIVLEQVGMAPQLLMATDGRHLASVSGLQLDVWDLRSGRAVLRLPGLLPTGLVAMNLATAGDRLVVADAQGRLVVVEIPSGRLVQVVSDECSVRDVAFDRTGRYLAAVAADGALRTWELGSGRLLGVLPGHDGPIQCVAFSGPRMLIATAGEDRTVRLWSPFGSRDHQVLYGHVGVVTRLAVTPAGDRLVSASEDGSLRVWDTTTGEPLFARTDFPHHVNTAAVADDGRRVFTSYHASLCATDILAAAAGRTWPTGRGWVRDLAWAGGDRMLVADQDGCVLLDVSGAMPPRPLRGLDGLALACAVHAGKVAYAGSADGRVLRWELDSEYNGTVLHAGSGAVTDLAAGADGVSVFVLSGNTLARRDARTGDLVWQRTSSSRPLAVAALAADRRVVTGHTDGSVVFWDARSGEPLLTRKLGESPVRTVVCDPAGAYVAAGCADGACHVLRATTTVTAAQALRAAGTCAAMALHRDLRQELSTRDEVLAAIDRRVDLDPELRAWMRACERCWLPMPWATVLAAADLVTLAGLPAERYAAARRVADAYLGAVDPGHAMALGTVGLASARLGDFDRTLSATGALTDAELAAANLFFEPTLRAGRALARHARGLRAEAQADLARLAALAALADAEPSTVSLWREVEAALAR